MRKTTQYPASIKASFLAKVVELNGSSVIKLAKEFNIPYSTAYTWKKDMLSGSIKPASQSPKDKTAEEKLKIIIELRNLNDEEQGAYCRTVGVHQIQAEAWEQEILTGLGKTLMNKEQQKKTNKLNDEIKALKKDLKRKNKALAEVSALLILKKKADLLWGEHEDDV